MNPRLLRKVFNISIVIKGLDGAFELLMGFLSFFINPNLLNKTITSLFAHELSQDPNDFIANFLTRMAHDLSVGSQIFIALYLITHGVIKIFIVANLLKNRLWAYPVAILFFVGFLIYQVYEYAHTGSALMLILTIFDVLVIVMTFLEYRQVLAERTKVS